MSLCTKQTLERELAAVKERAAADAAAARTEADDRARTHKKRMLALMQRCQELEQSHASASATVSSTTVSTAAAYTAGGPIGRRASAAVQNLCKPASQLPDPAARNAAAPGWMSHNFD
jgi:hypothetical protein